MLKFQSNKWKKPIELKSSKLEPMKNWLKILCEKKEVNFKPEQISLSYDGEDVSLTESPLELEYEDGEILDCRIQV